MGYFVTDHHDIVIPQHMTRITSQQLKEGRLSRGRQEGVPNLKGSAVYIGPLHNGGMGRVVGLLRSAEAKIIDLSGSNSAEMPDANAVIDDFVGPLSERYGMVGDNAHIQSVYAAIRDVAPLPVAVLIMGETGTGKDLVARAIHQQSKRSDRSYFNYNVAAIPPELAASELFGHMKGAYTNAEKTEIGVFGAADKGTLFLNEVGEMPYYLQATLLQVLQDGRYKSVGTSQIVRTDVRIIAASNTNLHEKVRKGEFRADLFYRLNVVQMRTPSLRQRKEDIPALATYFSLKYGHDFKNTFMLLDRSAIDMLDTHDWPGNVRELENAVQRAIAVCPREHQYLTASDFSFLGEEGQPVPGQRARTLKQVVDHTKRTEILKALALSDQNVTHAAASLGIARRHLWYLMNRLGIKRRASSAESDTK